MNINVDKLKNTKVIIGIIAIILVIGFVIGLYTSKGLFKSDPEIPYFALNTDDSNNTVQLPATTELAVLEGWAGQRLCIPGRGKFATKENEPYVLSYTTTGELTSIYLISTDEMPLPWRQGDNLIASGTELVDYQHWNLIIHFDNPLSSCKTLQSKNTSGYCDPFDCNLKGSGERATPTPYMSPTPTPQASFILQKVIDNISASKSIIVSSDSEPDEISKIIVDNAQAKSKTISNILSNLISGLENPDYGSNTWINNVSHKGFKGNVKSDLFQSLVPDIPTGANINLTIWVTDDSKLKRLQIEGPLSDTDAKDSIRTFEISDSK